MKRLCKHVVIIIQYVVSCVPDQTKNQEILFLCNQPTFTDLMNAVSGVKVYLIQQNLYTPKNSTSVQGNSNTTPEHTPGNPPSQLWKESLYSLLVKVKGCVPKVCWNNLRIWNVKLPPPPPPKGEKKKKTSTLTTQVFKDSMPIYDPCVVYLPTFTINFGVYPNLLSNKKNMVSTKTLPPRIPRLWNLWDLRSLGDFPQRTLGGSSQLYIMAGQPTPP